MEIDVELREFINERRRSVLFGGTKLELFLILDYLRAKVAPNKVPKPRMIQLEPTKNCNLSCYMCIRKDVSENASMSLALFKKIITRDFHYRHFLLLYGQGEPFLVQDLFKMIRFERDLGNYVTTVTNGTIIDRDICQKLVDSELNMLRISIDGASAATYDSVRKGANFSEILENVDFLVCYLGKKRVKPRLAITFMALKENYHDMPGMVSLASDLGIPCLEIKDLPPYCDSPIKPLCVEIEKDPELKHDVQETVRKLEVEARRRNICVIRTKLHSLGRTWKCMNPWFKTFITSEGKVAVCSKLSTSPSLVVGDLTRSAFDEIWNGPAYGAVRNSLNAGCAPFEACRTVF